ncbi:hypothetical protein BLNAU_21368 [Blattamonas nauphoetae]|uniref:Uncharacterized protein n=1 Tax=Blattamonas nauphoetae TaxID=2049346 RepID=A0ABQ9WW44_9EUKA|nr:hypothetical protein BLNAU_21368 [Blattamonas nauphoetae]
MAKKKKKKKKKRGDALVTELGGGGGSDLKTTRTIICFLLVFLHVLMMISVVVTLVIYIIMSSSFSSDLSTLREISRLAEYTGRTATYALMLFVHETEFGFTASIPTDGKTPSLLPVTAVDAGLLEVSEFMSRLVSQIFDLTTYTDPWISPNVDSYEFTVEYVPIAADHPARNTKFARVDRTPIQSMVQSELLNSMTLTSALTAIAQKTMEMGVAKPVSTGEVRPDTGLIYHTISYPTFQRDMVYLVNNAPQPVMNALKRAIFAYMDETTASANLMLNIYVIVTVAAAVLIVAGLVVLYLLNTAWMMQTRKKALMDLLEVPKPKLQSVIRRLIAHSDDTMTVTVTMSQDDSDEDEAGQSEDQGDEEGDEDQHSNVNEQHPDTGASPVPNMLSTHRTGSQATSNPSLLQAGSTTFELSNFATPSDYRNPLAQNSTDNFPLSLTASPALGNMSIPGQTMSPFGLQDFQKTGLLGNQQSPAIPSLSAFTSPDSKQNPLGVQTPFSAHSMQLGGQSQLGSLIQMPGQPTPSFHNMPGNFTPTPRMGSQLQYGMINPIDHEEQKRADAKNRKAEERKRKAEEEEKKRKADEKKQREDEARRQKEEEEAMLASGKASDAQKGYIRNVISDEKWLDKYETDLIRLEDMHANLPSPLSAGIIVTLLLDLIILIISISILVAIAFVLVTSFSKTNVNITMSGMRTSILALCEYLTLRILFPFSNLSPADKEINFTRSTNPVFTGFEHTGSNKPDLYALLVKSSNYFQQLHSATHYGDSEYAFMNDTLYDSIPTTRLSTEENRNILLAKGDCYMEDSEIEDCQNKLRIYNLFFPVYGLSTLISQVRLYIWIMKYDGYETYVNFHPLVRFLASAFRFDLRSGMNKLTNEILATSQKDVTNSQTIIMALTIAACVFFFIGLLAFSITWLNKVMQTNEESEKLLELMPVGHEEKEIDLLPSMLTGYRPMDEGRSKIVDAALTVLDSLRQNDKLEILLPNIDLLMITTTQVFAEEETEMAKRDYEQLEEHKREHILIRQRLTKIAEEVRKDQIAPTRIAHRNLIRLYDRHFIDDDVQFGNSIPPEEKQAVHNDMEFVEDAAQDVGELGEPGQDAT